MSAHYKTRDATGAAWAVAGFVALSVALAFIVVVYPILYGASFAVKGALRLIGRR